MTVDVGEFPRVRLDQQARPVPVRGDEWKAHHQRFRDLAEATGEYAGIPLDIDGFNLVLEDAHPHKADFERILSHPEPQKFRCTTDDVDDTVWIRNSWWCRQRNARVYLFDKGGKVEVLLDRRERTPARRITFAMMTLGAQQGAIELARHIGARKARGTWSSLTAEDIAYREMIREAVQAWNRREAVEWEPPVPAFTP